MDIIYISINPQRVTAQETDILEVSVRSVKYKLGYQLSGVPIPFVSFFRRHCSTTGPQQITGARAAVNSRHNLIAQGVPLSNPPSKREDPGAAFVTFLESGPPVLTISFREILAGRTGRRASQNRRVSEADRRAEMDSISSPASVINSDNQHCASFACPHSRTPPFCLGTHFKTLLERTCNRKACVPTRRRRGPLEQVVHWIPRYDRRSTTNQQCHRNPGCPLGFGGTGRGRLLPRLLLRQVLSPSLRRGASIGSVPSVAASLATLCPCATNLPQPRVLIH
jgi:hypothetical protein